MKFIASRILIVLILVTLTGSLAFAKGSRTTVTFAFDTKVNNTLVKPGDYDVKFDDKTGELTVVKNGKVIAKATGRVEKRDHKTDQTQLRIVSEGSDRRLVGITFGGSDQEVVVG